MSRKPKSGNLITKLDELLKKDSTVAEDIDGAIAYAKRFAIGSLGAFFVNGRYHDFDEVRSFRKPGLIYYLALFRFAVLLFPPPKY